MGNARRLRQGDRIATIARGPGVKFVDRVADPDQHAGAVDVVDLRSRRGTRSDRCSRCRSSWRLQKARAGDELFNPVQGYPNLLAQKRTLSMSALGQLQRLGVALRAGLLGFARTGSAVSTLTGSIPDARRRTVSKGPCAQGPCRYRLLTRALSGEARRHRSMPSGRCGERPVRTSVSDKPAWHAAADAVFALSLCGA